LFAEGQNALKSNSISQTDVEEMRVLIKNFSNTKEELHNLNAQKMENVRAEQTLHGNYEEAEYGTKRRIYSSAIGRKVGEKSLENCRKIS
jgi:hypothetical protein